MAPPTRYKSLERRLLEAQQVRTDLQRIGALMDTTRRERVTHAMNAFVRDGTGATLRLRLYGDDCDITVLLSAREGTRSGVTVEHANPRR